MVSPTGGSQDPHKIDDSSKEIANKKEVSNKDKAINAVGNFILDSAGKIDKGIEMGKKKFSKVKDSVKEKTAPTRQKISDKASAIKKGAEKALGLSKPKAPDLEISEPLSMGALALEKYSVDDSMTIAKNTAQREKFEGMLKEFKEVLSDKTTHMGVKKASKEEKADIKATLDFVRSSLDSTINNRQSPESAKEILKERLTEIENILNPG